MKENRILDKIHLMIIIIGICYISIGIFHKNIWFDEAYTVSIIKYSFREIWTLSSYDVHPVLYYWMLKIINFIFGSNLYVYRIFSMLPIAMTGILGYTCIKKDFGRKVGILFSFLIYFLPTSVIFAGELRMYSWAMFFTTLLLIYSIKVVKKETLYRYITLTVISICCMYLHYYSLLAVLMSDIILFIIFVKNKRVKSIVYIIMVGIIQLLLYMPWLINLFSQLKYVSQGFWIYFYFPKTVIELVSFQFIGKLNYLFGFIVSIIFYVLAIKVQFKNRQEKIGVFILTIYFLIILIVICCTIFIKTSILYYRYLFVIMGLYIFSFSNIFSKSKKASIAVAVIIMISSVINNYKMIKINYSDDNIKPFQYVEERLSQNDIIVYSNSATGSVASVKYPNNKQYYYNKNNWRIEQSYKVFSPQMNICQDLSFLEDYEGKIFIIDSDEDLYNKIKSEKYQLIENKKFQTLYQEYYYSILILDKVK